METSNKIEVNATINQDVKKVWEYWNLPEHIMNWCFASEDWHVPNAKNDLNIGGKLCTTMAAKDGSFSFDFEGVYTEIEHLKKIVYTIADGREVDIEFIYDGEATTIIEKFEAESTHPIEMQRAGWQAILNNFKSYTENN